MVSESKVEPCCGKLRGGVRAPLPIKGQGGEGGPQFRGGQGARTIPEVSTDIVMGWTTFNVPQVRPLAFNVTEARGATIQGL